MKMIAIRMLVVVCLVSAIAGCGTVSKITAKVSGNDKVCVDGVQYIQFTSGVSVAYNTDGSIKVCN